VSKLKKVLITGADGFIGSHLAEYFIRMGMSVRSTVLYNSFGSWGWLDNSDYTDDMEVIMGDIRDESFCSKATKDIDYVFNLAALIAIPYSYEAPSSYIQTNVMGTTNLLNSALKNNVERFFQTSTSEVYGTAIYSPIDEKHAKQPQSPYSASKIASDAIAESFYNSFNLPVTIVRPFNTYGPRQSARAFIPAMIIQALNEKIIKVGDLSPTRDLNFVEDTCRGFDFISKSDKTIGHTFNIGYGKDFSMKSILEMIINLTNSEAAIIEDKQRVRPKNSEVFKLLSDTTALSELTGYRPKYSLEEGIKKTIDWFKVESNIKKYKSKIYNV